MGRAPEPPEAAADHSGAAGATIQRAQLGQLLPAGDPD